MIANFGTSSCALFMDVLKQFLPSLLSVPQRTREKRSLNCFPLCRRNP